MTEDEGNELLLSHTAWLHALARSVVARRDLAADVAQETMMVAWRRGLTGVLDVRAYLAQILRRLAGRRVQGEQRRRQLERAVPPREPVPPTVDLVAKASMQREIVDAVLRLDEPYRTTLLLRFQEERSYLDIAAATAAPVETVRTRIKRGLQRLRADLDGRHGETKAWALPMLGLTGFHEATAMATAGAAGAATGAGVVGAGVLLMSAQTKVAAAAVMVALAWASWQFWPQGDLPRPPAADAEVTAAPLAVGGVPAATKPDDLGGDRTVLTPREDAVVVTAPSLPRWSIAGRVLDEASNAPVAFAEVRFAPQSNGHFVDRDRDAFATAADGSFTFDCEGVGPGFNELVVQHDAYAATNIPLNEAIARAEAAGTRRVAVGDVLLAHGAALAGRVLDADGKTPMPGAHVLYYRASLGVPMQFFANAREVAAADAHGRFELPFRVGPGYRRHWLVAMTASRLGWRELDLSRRPAATAAFDLTMLPAAPLRVHVVDTTGRPLAGATAVAWIPGEPLSSVYDPASQAPAQQPLPAFLKATTNADGIVLLAPPIAPGGFRLGVEMPGARCELIVEAAGRRTWRQQVALTVTEQAIEARLAAVADTTLTGVVLTKAGTAIGGALVELPPRTARCDAGGHFRFEHVDVAAGVLPLKVSAPGFVASSEQVACSDERTEITVELRLQPARRLRGVVVDQDGLPMAKVFVACGTGCNTSTAADGRFDLDGVATTESLVVVMPQRVEDGFDTTVMPLGDAVDELRLVVNRRRGGARVELQLVDRATGAALEPTNCWLFPLAANGTQAVGRQLQVRDGLCFDEATPPGRYAVRAETHDGHRGSRELEVLAGVPLIQERMLLDAPGRIRCTIDGSALSRLPDRLRLELVPSDGGRLSVPGRQGAAADGSSSTLLDLAAERSVDVVGAAPDVELTLRVLDEQVVGEACATVAADGVASIELRLQPAGTVQFVCGKPAAADVLLAQWQRADASWSSPQQLLNCRGRRAVGTMRAPTGSIVWRVTFAGPDGAQVQREGRVAVAAGTVAVVSFD